MPLNNVINLFVPNAPFLYPMKTSENLTIFWCFQGVEKGSIRSKWVKDSILTVEWVLDSPPSFLSGLFWRGLWNPLDKVLKNGPSKTCGKQPLKKLKDHGLLKS